MSKYDDLKRQYDKDSADDSAEIDRAMRGIREMAEDASSTAELYKNAGDILSDIDREFMEETQLNKEEVAFLFLATSLQICRWAVIGKINQEVTRKIDEGRLDHNDKKILDMEEEKRIKYREKHGTENIEGEHRNWVNIVFNGVPYDITNGSPKFGVNMEGKYHRIHTLGHDPVLGWIFGTMNILSDTITLDDFRTYNVDMRHQAKRWTGKTTLAYGFREAYASIQEDKKRLPAAVFAQGLHMKSDMYTKLGLPVPVIETFSPDFAGKLYKEGYDTLLLMKDVAVVGGQAVSAILINMLIAAIHGLLYNPDKYPDRDLYEVKTRKILTISNVLASASNVIWVGGNIYMDNPDAWKSLDIGGILVTAYRLVTDTRFIRDVKKEYLESEWKKRVVGEPYSFIMEADGVSKKDIKKGIEIQAKADAEKQDKVAKGLDHQGKILENIEANQKRAQEVVGEVLDDMAAAEAESLYGIKITKSPKELGNNEKQVLCAALYTLMDKQDQNSDYQRVFYLNLEKYLGVSKRFSEFDFSTLNNIDSHADRVIMLKVICSFLALNDPSFGFTDDEEYRWLTAFTSQEEVNAICSEIGKEFHVLGEVGIINRYKSLEPSVSSKILSESGTVTVESPEEAAPATEDFNELKQIIGSYVADEEAFGKQQFPSYLAKELKKAFPTLNLNTLLFSSKAGNGYLLFSTSAMYIKSGSVLRGEYVRIPYKDIHTEKLATAAGKAKDTRKLIISFDAEEGNRTISVDDSKITEERLQELLKEIVDSGCNVAESDFFIDMPSLPSEEQILFFKALGNILNREDRCLTELYLIIKDYGLAEQWNEIAESFSRNDELSVTIQSFVDNIPYPSAENISRQAVLLALQTLFRTNRLEGKELSLLSAESETMIRMFDIGVFDEKEFNAAIKLASENQRKPNIQDCYEIEERLPVTTLYKSRIISGVSVLNGIVEQALNKKTLGDSIKGAVNRIPTTEDLKESADKIKDGAGKILEELQKKTKKSGITIPKDYRAIKQKLPEEVGIPKDARAYGKHTENVDALIVIFPVTEKESMPFDNPQIIIDEQHAAMGENEGLVEVKNGTTAKGYPYIYNITKRLMHDEENPARKEYTLNFNMKTENDIQFVNASFAEEGITGVRENLIAHIYAKNNDITLEEVMDQWSSDPYDSDFREGFLMNRSEGEEWDEHFPQHALSEARTFVKHLVEMN